MYKLKYKKYKNKNKIMSGGVGPEQNCQRPLTEEEIKKMQYPIIMRQCGEKWDNSKNIFAIFAHGSLLCEGYSVKEFVVPNGIKIITFGLCGDIMTNEFATSMWNIFSNNTIQNQKFIEYISDPKDTQYKTENWPRILDYEYDKRGGDNDKPYLINLEGKFKNMHIYSGGDTMHDHVLHFEPYFYNKKNSAMKVGIYSVPIGMKRGRYMEDRTCQLRESKIGYVNYEPEMRKSLPSLVEVTDCGFINGFPTELFNHNEEREVGNYLYQNYNTPEQKIKDVPLSSLVKRLNKGTYFLISCRSNESTDNICIEFARANSTEHEQEKVNNINKNFDPNKAFKSKIMSDETEKMFKGIFK